MPPTLVELQQRLLRILPCKYLGKVFDEASHLPRRLLSIVQLQPTYLVLECRIESGTSATLKQFVCQFAHKGLHSNCVDSSEALQPSVLVVDALERLAPAHRILEHILLLAEGDSDDAEAVVQLRMQHH